MKRGRPLLALTLNMEEHNRLVEWTRRHTSAQALALSARMVLACGRGEANDAIAQRLHVTPQTVSKWRRRFRTQRVDGLRDAPRPGQPRKISDAQVEEVIARTLESRPDDATPWSTRSMAQATGLNQAAIFLIWRAFGLQPHREETFKLCVNEKSQIQALDRTQPPLALTFGVPARHHDAVRGAGLGHRPRHRLAASPPPRRRIPEVPAHHR